MSQLQRVGFSFFIWITSSLDLFSDVVMSSLGSFGGLGPAGSGWEAFFFLINSSLLWFAAFGSSRESESARAPS